MNHSNPPRALLGVALLAVCTSPRAEDETLTVVGKRSQHEEVATATRTATPAKLVPQSIESVKASELTAFGQPTLSEALTGIPGVNASGDTRFDGVTIRGFSASNDFYLDGLRDDMQYTRDLGNIERVEVLKGPAAVLYGRGSTGGIVNRVSKVPQKGQASSVSAQVGSFDLELVQEFFTAFCNHSGANIHVNLAYGDNLHHIVEAVFKALARALDEATQFDPRVQGVLSSKGALE